MSLFTRFRPSPADASAATPDANELPASNVADTNPTAKRLGEDTQTAAHTVDGERGVASIHGTHSLQSRLSNFLAGGLMGLIALGFLAWYYSQTFANRSRSTSTQTSTMKAQLQGEMALPPLGRVDPPMVERVLGPPPELPAALPFALDEFQSSARGNPATSSYMAPIDAPRSTVQPAPVTVDRRLAGPVFVSTSGNAPAASEQSVRDAAELADTGDFGQSRAGSPGMGTSSSPDLDKLLLPTRTPAVQAKVLPTQRLLLPKGTFLDCTLETAIDSSLPGMTTCITATDTFGADGKVVLLERGTKLVGETRGDVRQGSARVYVLWTEARTPEGVVVPLASPGTDALGRAGLPGDVNRHFWERFGAAILVSVIDGAVQAAIQRSNSGGGAVIVNPSTSRDVMTEVLRSTINIPPTVTKSHGDRIAVVVARDLDFRSVYELRPNSVRR
ncbi:type IV secretion system protein VirB10 [Steroidobacter cummioxidans]|uniref:type IV secretion system protein VirB10 n=1 Tax=Steroidobacter cummioxidans TaxID=1803913 RepID=UPI000E3221DE|nr:type IV secretion system protein VirB10 [Steroidobacter cummioxidans]